MSDIISARCFGCGHTIKVPAGLGGKKARCPQCTNTITIPNPNDTQHEDILSDADLPEVAVDNHKFVPEEGDADHPDAVAPPPGPAVEDPSEARRKSSSGTGVRRAVSQSITSASHRRVERSGSTQPRYTPAPAPAKPAASSNQGMVIGIALGVVALMIIGFVVANKGSKAPQSTHNPPKKEREKDRETPKTAQYSADDQALIARTLDYAAAVNRGDASVVFRFYTYDPEEERKVRIRATELVDTKVTYDNPQVSAVSAANGTITFSHSGGKTKSLQWKQVDSVWMIAEKPSP